jgi:hypothetical protein
MGQGRAADIFNALDRMPREIARRVSARRKGAYCADQHRRKAPGWRSATGLANPSATGTIDRKSSNNQREAPMMIGKFSQEDDGYVGDIIGLD